MCRMLRAAVVHMIPFCVAVVQDKMETHQAEPAGCDDALMRWSGRALPLSLSLSSPAWFHLFRVPYYFVILLVFDIRIVIIRVRIISYV